MARKERFKIHLLVFRTSKDEVVRSLVDSRQHKASTLADAHDLGDFPGRIVAQSELLAGRMLCLKSRHLEELTRSLLTLNPPGVDR